MGVWQYYYFDLYISELEQVNHIYSNCNFKVLIKFKQTCTELLESILEEVSRRKSKACFAQQKLLQVKQNKQPTHNPISTSFVVKLQRFVHIKTVKVMLAKISSFNYPLQLSQ
jgi:hypothetical protein